MSNQPKKKLKRNVVGSVCKAKEAGKPPYIKMRDGKILRLESAKYQKEQLDKVVAEGKVSPDLGEKISERIAKVPEWVLFEVIELVEEK